MIIESTGILDISTMDSQASKILLMDEIINKFTPLFYEEIDRKKQQMEESKADYLKLKESVSTTQSTVKLLEQDNQRETLLNALLKDINSLIEYDVLYGSNKKVVFEIMNSLNELSSVEIQGKIKHLQRMLDRNVNKVITN